MSIISAPDTRKKLEILSDASQYDLACACGTDIDRRKRGEGDRWLYPVSLPGGGQSIMLKTLMSNACSNDCKYCPFRAGSDVRRCSLKPGEVAQVFMDYLRRKKLQGIFISSGVPADADGSMETLIDTARILRRKYGYRGYIHLKVIPGASDAAIEEAVSIASTVSINLETPTNRSFAKLSRSKNFEQDIIRPLKLIHDLTAPGSRYAKVRQTTQFIVGASDETDAELVEATHRLYNRLRLSRVYYSAYQRGLGESDIPGESEITGSPGDLLTREHRLYQVDFLFRQYKWTRDDIGFLPGGRLSLEEDPKTVWAKAHPESYPVKINHATKEELLRVPGLGPITVNRIIKRRKQQALRDFSGLNLKGKRLATVSEYAVL